jgi:hypothetical protein
MSVWSLTRPIGAQNTNNIERHRVFYQVMAQRPGTKTGETKKIYIPDRNDLVDLVELAQNVTTYSHF